MSVQLGVLPRLKDAPAFLAWLCGGPGGRPVASDVDSSTMEQAVELLLATRLAAEVTALGPRFAESGLPTAAKRCFAVERARIAHVATSRAATVRRLSEILSAAGLEAMLYKGEAVVRLTHGDFSRRPMTDVDVIVRPEHLKSVTTALRAGGFKPSHETAMHDVLMDVASKGTGFPRGVAVEVHSDVMDPPHPFDLDLPGILERGAASELPGLLLPRTVDALFLHAFHLTFHEQDVRKSFGRLRDVALLALACEERHGAEDSLESLSEMGRRSGLGSALAMVGRRAAAWTGGPDWLGQLPDGHSAGRRRFAIALIRRELDEGLVHGELRTHRTYSRRLAAALWQPRWWASASAISASLWGKGSPGSRLARLPRLLGRYVRALRGRPS